MVYCGRPSGGCYACRERKSRCDKLPGGCTQCKKAKRQCPGYRELRDVIFHDESEKVIRKSKAKEAESTIKCDTINALPLPLEEIDSTSSSCDVEEDGTNSQHVTAMDFHQKSPTNLTLLPRIEELATGLFVSNFIIGDSGPGHFDYLPDVYREHSLDEGLISSMTAVGLASYAHIQQEPALLHRARLQYVRAIQHTNRALHSVTDARKDTTLLSILVLGIFETVTGCERRSLSDWSRHINGAAAVVCLRGAEQIKNIAGRRMLFQVTSNLLITCLARGAPLPAFIYELTEEAGTMIEDPDPSLIVQHTMMKVCQLRANIVAGVFTDLRMIIDEAIELERVLLDLTKNKPVGWEYEVVYTDIESPYVYQGRYHIYADYWMAQLVSSFYPPLFMLYSSIYAFLPFSMLYILQILHSGMLSGPCVSSYTK